MIAPVSIFNGEPISIPAVLDGNNNASRDFAATF